MIAGFIRLGLLFQLPLLFFESWGLAHILAVFGIFFAITYPIWWAFFPKYTICFFCKSKRSGEICPICHEIVKNKKSTHPKTLRSAIINSLLILLFTVISAFVVYFESKVLLKIGFPPTAKTASFIIPPKGQYRLGETFTMKVDISGIKTPINAVQADIGYDPNILEVLDISTEGSFANIFIQKEINNESGYARLTGGLPNPGFSGERGTFATLILRGKNPGPVEINFLPTSMILANNGKASNILKDYAHVSYLILPEKFTTTSGQAGLGPKELGTSTDNTQMIFYDEKAKNDVLGAETNLEIEKGQKQNIGKAFLGVLENIDSGILKIWNFGLVFLKNINFN